jgi:hypothetical protein
VRAGRKFPDHHRLDGACGIVAPPAPALAPQKKPKRPHDIRQIGYKAGTERPAGLARPVGI